MSVVRVCVSIRLPLSFAGRSAHVASVRRERLPQREGLLGFHFPTFWPFGLSFSCHFGLLGVHFPVISAFWTFISFHFGFLGLHFLDFGLLGFHFLSIWACRHSFPSIFACWAYIFFILAFGLPFWPFEALILACLSCVCRAWCL